MNKQQLASRIWASANKMRGKVEANEYKDYILGLIFYKFLSDNEIGYLRSQGGWTDCDFPALKEDYEDGEAKSTMNFLKLNIGYFISYDNLFSTWLRNDTDFTVGRLSEALNAFDRLVSDTYKPVYNGIFKTLQAGLGKLGDNPAKQTRALKDIIKLIKDIPTDGQQDYDVLGYVYEFLISNFAASAGKKAGEFYTPHEVAILMSEIVAEHHKNKEHIEIYDPTSGSGSLLITIGKSVGRHIHDRNAVKYYAQELMENTYNLTRMNLVMRGIQPANITTRNADSLEEDWPMQTAGSEIGRPLYVDAVVSNPPYSQHWSIEDRELDPRFKNYGVAPASKADYAFLLHELNHIKPDGILTIVLPHGVLFRGNPYDGSEGQIRRNLIEYNNIDTIIGLPSNIFFGTGIPTIVMVLKRHRTDDKVLIIDASKGFVKEGKQNKLRACDIRKISDTVKSRQTIDKFSRLVTRDEIRQNGYNLNIPRYVDSAEPAVQYDILATMQGGIPNSEIDGLTDYWQALPSLRGELFNDIDGRPYSIAATTDTAATIEANEDVARLQQQFNDAFSGFADALHSMLIDNVADVQELNAQDAIAVDIFRRLQSVPLVDKYTAYQALAERWDSVANDIEIIRQEGMDAVRTVEPAFKMKKDKDEYVEVADGQKGRILPFELVQHELLPDQLYAITQKEQRLAAIDDEIQSVVEEFTDEETEAYVIEEKLDAAKVKADEKTKGKNVNPNVEPVTREKLLRIVVFFNEQSSLKKEIAAAKIQLEKDTIDVIHNLTAEQAKAMLHVKWITPICNGINETLAVALADLETKVSALVKKYAVSYTALNVQLAESKKELASLIDELTGDEFTMAGLQSFKDSLKD